MPQLESGWLVDAVQQRFPDVGEASRKPSLLDHTVYTITAITCSWLFVAKPPCYHITLFDKLACTLAIESLTGLPSGMSV